MAAVPEDEESLLASGRETKNHSRGFGKTACARWQVRYRSLFQRRGIRTVVATSMALAIPTIIFIAIWMLYVKPLEIIHAFSDGTDFLENWERPWSVTLF